MADDGRILQIRPIYGRPIQIAEQTLVSGRWPVNGQVVDDVNAAVKAAGEGIAAAADGLPALPFIPGREAQIDVGRLLKVGVEVVSDVVEMDGRGRARNAGNRSPQASPSAPERNNLDIGMPPDAGERDIRARPAPAGA